MDGEVIDDLDENDMQEPADEDDEDDHAMGEGSSDMAEAVDMAVHTLRQHTAEVVSVAAHPSVPMTLGSGACDDKAVLWQADAGQAVELAGHSDTVGCVAFSGSGSMLATGSVDGTVGIWQTADSAKLHVLEGPGDEIEWLAWHPRGDVVMAGSADYTAWLWNAATAVCMQVLSGHSGPITCGGFTPDGKAVYTGSMDGSLRLWDPKTGSCTSTVSGYPFHEQGIVCAALSADGSLAVTGGEEGSLHLSNPTTGKALGALEGHIESVECVALPAQLPGVAVSCSLDGRLMVWDVPTRGMRVECKHPQQVVRFAVHPTEPVAATACLDGVVRLWDLRTGALLQAWTGHSSGVQAVVFTCDGSAVASAGDDQAVRLFKVGT